MTNVLLIDLPSIVYPLWHVTSDDPNPNAVSIQALDRIRSLAHSQPYTAIAHDSKHSVRKATDPTYKANRSSEGRAPLYHQIDIVLDALRGDGFPVWTVDGFEADDVIASAVGYALKTPDTTVQIVSADKDLLALVNERVTLKSLKDGSVIDSAAVLQKFGVRPEQMHDYLCLVGDASDNIKGADKIGPVTAVKLLATYGTLEGIYNAWTATPEAFTPGVRTSLETFLSRVDTVRDLVRLRADLALPFEEIAVERKTPMFDTPDSGFAFDADPTGLPSQAAPPQEPPPAPPVVEAPAPARRPRQASPQKPLDVVEAAPVKTPEPSPEPAPKAWAKEPEKMRAVVATEPQTTALVPQVIDVEYTRQLEPRTIVEAQSVAKWAADSRLFGSYGSQQAILMMVMAGREMGMATMHSLRAFDVIDGKPTLKADAIRALILRSGMAEYFRIIERTATVCTFATKRKGDPEVTLSYSIEDARLAGLIKPGGGWVKNPADMLVARASAKLGRLVYPDVMHGLYAPEELES